MGSMNGFMSVGLGGILVLVVFLLIWFVNSRVRKRFFPENQTASPIIFTDSALEEKRMHPRANLRWPVTIETPEGTMRAETKDVSLGGAFILCEKPLPLKTEFRLALEIPKSDPLTLNAEVVWSNCNVPSDKVVHRGMGIRFVRNSEEDRRLLMNALGS